MDKGKFMAVLRRIFKAKKICGLKVEQDKKESEKHNSEKKLVLK